MRLPDGAHFSRPWRIHALAADFDLEDVWALPTPGRREDFPRLVEQFVGRERPGEFPLPFRALFALRWAIGRALGWDGPTEVTSLRERLPDDLRLRRGPDIRSVPGRETDGAPIFSSIYLTDDEWAAEITNRTVHGVLHVGWVEGGAQMAVLVKPAGRLGRAYLAAIKPFRLAIVYPMLLETIGRQWDAALGSKGVGRP